VLDVADAVSYSQFYFSREFSRHAHISIYDYMLKRKISEACKCLFATDIKIVDLAFWYGFQSHEVFTRAFRKMFGENPSEASFYKPFAIYEAIDDRYLEFLYGLKTELVEESIPACFFEVDAGADTEAAGCSLMVLYKENFFDCKSVLKGELIVDESSSICFPLNNLRHKLRIYHTDEKYSFRYFLDNTYDASEMGGNYILIKEEDGHIDFYISRKS
jgi:AraC-like DNA-binding protein